MKIILNKNIFRESLLRSFIAISLLSSCFSFAAEPYPNQTIKFVVPYSPGGLPDTVARQLSVLLGERLGQPVIVDNKPGAGGIIAGQVVKSSPADGYTFLVTDTISYNTSHLLSSNTSYDPRKDFKPIALVAKAPDLHTGNESSVVTVSPRWKPLYSAVGTSGCDPYTDVVEDAVIVSVAAPMVKEPAV